MLSVFSKDRETWPWAPSAGVYHHPLRDILQKTPSLFLIQFFLILFLKLPRKNILSMIPIAIKLCFAISEASLLTLSLRVL